MSIFQLFLSVNSHLVRSTDFSEPLNYFDPYPLSVLDFSESGLKIKQIIESVYTDGITGLDNIEVKGQNIVGTFSDYISPTLTNKFSFEITPNDVSYQLINPDAASYSEYLDFAKVAKPKPVVDSALQTKADKSGRTRNCTTGKTMPCGARCQAIGKPCKGQPLAPELKQVQAEVVDNFNKDLAKVKKENPAKKVSKVTQDKQADSKSPSVNESTPSTKKETIKKAVEPKVVAKSQETAKKETIKEPAATSEKKDTLSTKALKLYDQNKEVTDAVYKQTEGKSGLYDTNTYGGGGEVDRLDIAGAALKQAAETGKIKGDAAVQSSYIENLLQHADRSITNDNSLRDKVTQQSMKSAELLYPLLSDEAKDQIAARDYDRFSLAQMTETTGKRNRNPYSMEIRKDLVNRIKGKIKSGEMVDLYDELSKPASTDSNFQQYTKEARLPSDLNKILLKKFDPKPPSSRQAIEDKTDKWLAKRGYDNEKNGTRPKLYEHDMTHILLHEMVGLSSEDMDGAGLTGKKGMGPNNFEEAMQRNLMRLAYSPNMSFEDFASNGFGYNKEAKESDYPSSYSKEDVKKNMQFDNNKHFLQKEVLRRIYDNPHREQYLKDVKQYASSNVKNIGDMF